MIKHPDEAIESGDRPVLEVAVLKAAEAIHSWDRRQVNAAVPTAIAILKIYQAAMREDRESDLAGRPPPPLSEHKCLLAERAGDTGYGRRSPPYGGRPRKSPERHRDAYLEKCRAREASGAYAEPPQFEEGTERRLTWADLRARAFAPARPCG